MKQTLYISSIVLLLLIVFNSCKVGKRYARPELGLPEETVWSADTSSVADLPWESLYRDSVLQGLIHKALENNKDQLIAAARIKEMMAAKRISFANQFPQVDAKLNAQKEELNYGGHNAKPDPEYSAKLALSWELDFFGRLQWASEADMAQYLQSVEAQRALQLTLVAEVATKYYELAALDQELSIVEQTLEARTEAVRLAKLRYEGGLTSQTAYNQAQVELARTETLLPALQQDIEIKENDLSLLLGEYSHKIPRSYTLSYASLPDTLPMGLSSALLERRPDIRAAEQQLRAANAKVGVTQAEMFPRITLTGNLGVESDELNNLLKSPAWFIAGDLLQPVFAMGRNRARVKVAKAQYEQEVYRYQKTVLAAFQEVNNALVTSRKVKEVRRSRSRLLDAADTYMYMAQLQYINGITNYIDVLDAQRGLFDARIGLNNAVLDEQLSIIYLYKALGGGYQ